MPSLATYANSRVAHTVQHIARLMNSTGAEQRLARLVLVAGVAVWIANALLRWRSGGPLGHDEARYALDARDALDGQPIRFLYAGGGMTAIGIPGVLAGATEQMLRLVPTLLGGGFLAAAWVVARAVCGGTTAGWVVGVLAGSRTLAHHSVEFLSDLPSTACLLLAIAILVGELTRDAGPRWRLCAVAPLCVAAFHIRYGSCLSIAAIGSVFLVAAALEGRLRAWPVPATVVLAIALFLPHALWAIEKTGSPTGILHLSAAIPPPPDTVFGYLQRPFAMYGALITPLMVIGLLAARRDWPYTALLWIALVQLVVLSVTTQAQARYVFLATVLLVVLGVDAAVRIATLATGKARVVAAAFGVAAVVASWVQPLIDGVRYRDWRARGNARALIAGAVIEADRDPATSCEVLASDTTRVEWYSGCVAVQAASSNVGGRLYAVRNGIDSSLPDGARWIAFVPGVVDVIRLR
jgi:drug/metabolite transporter superfamily protein YnfA